MPTIPHINFFKFILLETLENLYSRKYFLPQ
ncbi:DUF1563 domain-containing protein [Candidatus Pelagibacter sp. Uisw_092]